MGESFPVDIQVDGNVGGKEPQNREELEAKWKKEWEESMEAKMREQQRQERDTYEARPYKGGQRRN